MESYLNKNGSFLERRKMYIDFPMHNLKSKVELGWIEQKDQNTMGRKFKIQSEAEQLKRRYNQKVDQKLNLKYRSYVDTYRSIPNQITLQNDKDILTKQLEDFNQSKLKNYQNHRDLFHNQKLDHGNGNQDVYFEHPSPKLDQRTQLKSWIQKSQNEASVSSQNKSRQYPRLQHLVKGYGDLSIEHSFRNIKPDDLQYFLRQKATKQKIKPIHVSLNLIKRQQNH